MKVLPDFKYVTVGQCPEITLVRLSIRSIGTLAIKLSNDVKGNTLLALLDHPEFPMSFVSLESSFNCIAYNGDWFFELLPNRSSYPGNRAYGEISGIVFAQDGEQFIALDKAGSQSKFDAGLINLTTGQFDDPNGNAVPFTNWRIWANEDDRDYGRVEPLFTFNHPL